MSATGTTADQEARPRPLAGAPCPPWPGGPAPTATASPATRRSVRTQAQTYLHATYPCQQPLAGSAYPERQYLACKGTRRSRGCGSARRRTGDDSAPARRRHRSLWPQPFRLAASQHHAPGDATMVVDDVHVEMSHESDTRTRWDCTFDTEPPSRRGAHNHARPPPLCANELPPAWDTPCLPHAHRLDRTPWTTPPTPVPRSTI